MKLLILFLLTLSNLLVAHPGKEPWLEDWIIGSQCMVRNEFGNAIKHYSNAMRYVPQGSVALQRLRNDRAIAYLAVEDVNAANEEVSAIISDFERDRDYTIENEAVKALWLRMSIAAGSGDKERSYKDLKLIEKYDRNLPHVQINQGYAFITNLQVRSVGDHNGIASLLADLGVCKGSEDVVFGPSGNCWVKMREFSEPCCADCGEERRIDLVANANVASCKERCSALAISAGLGCNFCPTPFAKAGCAAAVAGLLKTCSWCCEGSGFYERCLKYLQYFDSSKYDH
jgi:hypothetical protein